MSEVPWFSQPPEAMMLPRGNDDGNWFLHFYDPNGDRAVIWVTEGAEEQQVGQNVWHIEVDGDVATVSPSVHFIGKWHSPNPVKFKIVEKLKDG